MTERQIGIVIGAASVFIAGAGLPLLLCLIGNISERITKKGRWPLVVLVLLIIFLASGIGVIWENRDWHVRFIVLLIIWVVSAITWVSTLLIRGRP